jgi:hypothetical protein
MDIQDDGLDEFDDDDAWRVVDNIVQTHQRRQVSACQKDSSLFMYLEVSLQ